MPFPTPPDTEIASPDTENPEFLPSGSPTDNSMSPIPEEENISADGETPDSAPDDTENPGNQEVEELLKSLYDHWNIQEQPALDSRMRLLKLLDYYWQGVQNVFWNDKLGDFSTPSSQDLDEGEVLPKVINIYRPYGEAIIAALSALTPKVRFFPDDADSQADTLTAQAYSKIARKIEADNGETQLLTKALFIDYNQHFILSHVYADDKGYGTTEIPITRTEKTLQDNYVCPQCGAEATPDSFLPEPIPLESPESAGPDMGMTDNSGNVADLQNAPQTPEASTPEVPQMFPGTSPEQGDEGFPQEANPQGMPSQGVPPMADFQCQTCGYLGNAVNEPITNENIIEDFKTVNKKQICIDLYGSLNAWVPAWVKNQKETPMVAIDIEKDESWAKERWPKYADKISTSGDKGLYYRWARLPESSLYGNYTIVTVAQRWFRNWAFNYFEPEKANLLKTLFPNGVYCIFVNDILVDYVDEDLDDCIKISENPLYNSIYAQPRGYGMIDIQDMTTDNVNITNDTIRFGIPITFVRSDAVDLKKLSQSRARPGDMVAAKPSIAGSLNDQFFQTKTAQLSDEVPAFQKSLEQYAQFVSGAYASIYGGALSGSGGTLGEYESSKNQSLQRLQINWRLISKWWAETMLIACNQYVRNVQYDDKLVESQGNAYINTWIKLSELEGHVGKVVAETSDQFPTTWSQMRDILMNLLTLSNEEINAILSHPKNAPMVRNLLGLPNVYIPGSEDVDKQNLEIALLVKQQPNPPQIDPSMMQDPNVQAALSDPNAQAMIQQNPQLQQMMQPTSSIQPDAEVDNHEIHITMCDIWLKSPIGMAMEGTPGKENVKLHRSEHQMILQQQQMAEQAQQMMQQAAGQNQQQNPQQGGQENAG